MSRKRVHGREWVFAKLAHCLEQRPVSKTCGAVIVGGAGAGKTALCCDMVWPSPGGGGRAQRSLRRRLLAHHFCQAHNAASLSVSEFVRRLVAQLLGGEGGEEESPFSPHPSPPTPTHPPSPTCSASTISAQYADKIRNDPEIQAALRPDAIERDPDEALKKGVLFPLLELHPPKHCLFLLVDSIDEHQLHAPSGGGSSSSSSRSIAELLGSHHHLFPQWLMLVCTSRRQNKHISKMFTGFRKLTLDDLRKAHVVRDVQQYILARVHAEEGLRAGMRRETAEMLNQLQIKSAGCFLYLERVLDGLADKLMVMRDLREIPGTLNGLYLWLCQRLFHSHHLPKVQPILNVMLASRRPLTISEVYDAVWTGNTRMSRSSFTTRLHLLRRVLRLHGNGTLLLFHHSFAEWLLDVKHCTRKYLCSADAGHAMLAMSMTLRAKTLPPDEIQNLALHLTRMPMPPQNVVDALPVDYNTLIVLWLVQSGAKVENCLLPDDKPTPLQVRQKRPKPKKTKESHYEKLKESYEELEFEPYGRRDLPSSKPSHDDYDHLQFDLGKPVLQKDETGFFDKSPDFLKDINEQNFKFSATGDGPGGHVKLDSEDSGFVRSEDASTLGVTRHEVKEELSREEELDLLLHGLERTLNSELEDQEDLLLHGLERTLNSEEEELLCTLKPEGDPSLAIPKDPNVLKILTEAGAKVSNSNSLCRETQSSRLESPELALVAAAVALDPLEELMDALRSECEVTEGRLLHAVCTQDNSTLLQLVLTTHPDLDIEAEDRHGQTPLNLAARHGHLHILESLLDLGANVEHTDCEGWTALRAAAWGGHTPVVELLLARGASVDVADSDQRTALRAAAWGGHHAIVKLLVAYNADVNHTDDEGRTALIAASYMGHADIVEHLLDSGAELDHEDVDGRTALSVAALCVPHSEGYIKVVNLLLERGAAVDHQDKDGMTPLLVAAFEGHKDVCELLLEYEADVDHADRSGRTPLWAAASMGHAAVVTLLLFWGCYVDSIDNEGRTVLSVAAAQGNTAVVRQLLDRGLDEQHRDNSGWTPLHYAAFEGHVEVCEALLEGGGRVDEADNDGKGALLLAAQEGHAALVHTLLESYAAPPNQKAHDGKTALRLAALEGHYEIVRLLLSAGADVDAKDADGRTTLYVLALENRLPMVRFLLEQGRPDVESRDTEGRTALHVSAWQGHYEMVRLLLTLGRANVSGVDRENRTALHSASWQGHAPIVQLLLDHGAQADHTCNQGATALGIAAQEGHEACVLALLEHGADPAHSDRCGRNAFRVAAKSGHDAVVRLLQLHQHQASVSVKPSAPEMSGSMLETEYLSLTQHSSHSKSSSNMTDSTKSSHDPPQGCSGSRASPQQQQQLMSPIYASPPHSPLSDVISPEPDTPPPSAPLPPTAPPPSATDLHFARDSHMRIILGNTRPDPSPSQKPKRNGIVTNPALRLMSNVKTGLENAVRHTNKLNSHWKKETPL